jgi:hypothetical protein
LVRRENEHLRGRERAVVEEISTLKKCIQSQEDEVEVDRKAVVQEEADQHRRQSEIAHGLGFYRERLGLSFEKRSNGCLRCVFTLIDKNNLDRPFAFTIAITKV